MLIKVGLETQKFTGPFLWITRLTNEVKHTSSLDEDLGWASTSAREVSDFSGPERRMGAHGSVWSASILHSFLGSSARDLQGKLTLKEIKDFTNSI